MLRIFASVVLVLGMLANTFVARADDPAELTQLMRDLKSNEGVKKRKAASAIGDLGPKAKSAVPTVVSVLERDRDALVRRNLAQALGAIGGDSPVLIPALTKALKDTDPDVQAAAAGSLAKLGKPGMAALRKALSATDPLTRRNAADALATLGPGAKDAVPELMASFKKETPAGRRRDNSGKAALVEALGAIGPDAKAAIPMLEQSIAERNVDPEFRRVVNSALRKMKR